MLNKLNNKYLFIIFTSDFYKYYYSLNTANTLKACNKEVSIFITGYSCNFILDSWKNYDKKNIVASIKKNNMASYEEVLGMSLDLNIDFFYCNTALELLEIKEKKILKKFKIKPLGLYQIMNKFKDGQIIFI